jgi:hypothetical protein
MAKVLFLALVGTFVLVCSDDDNPVTEHDGFPHYKNLTQREHVLNNLEHSYNERVVTRFDELLDDNFTFFFSPGDVGGDIPQQWGRLQELRVTARLFDPALDQPPYPTCRSIRVDIKFEEGVDWVTVIPEDYPGELWYTTTLEYEFTFEMDPEMTYIAAPGSQAQFTVRNAGTGDAPQWRLVEWRDLAANSVALQSAASTDRTTWGGVKALYK